MIDIPDDVVKRAQFAFDLQSSSQNAMRAALRIAVEWEREQCAGIADYRINEWHSDLADACARDIAAAIRARSNPSVAE